METALDELRRTDSAVPSIAVVCTSQAISLILKLPISPHTAHATADIAEMVRWEIEPFLGGHESQACVCAFASASSEPDAAGQFDWFAAGIARRERDEWRERLSAVGVSLQSIYPLALVRSVSWLAPDPSARSESSRVLAVARHALQLPSEDGGTLELALPARETVLPRWKRPRNWVALAAVCALLAIGWCEVSVARREHVIRESLVEADVQLQNVTAGQADAASTSRETAQIETLLATNAEELDRLSLLQTVLERELPNCTSLLPRLLDAIEQAVSEQVAVDRVVRAEGNQVRVTGWSVSESAAQQFADRLGRHPQLTEWRVVEQNLRAAAGRLGLAGFRIELMLAQRERMEPKPNQSLANN